MDNIIKAYSKILSMTYCNVKKKKKIGLTYNEITYARICKVIKSNLHLLNKYALKALGLKHNIFVKAL